MNTTQRSTSQWLGGLMALAGLWLLISPFVLGLTSASAYWNEIVIGLIALVLGLAELSAPDNSWPSWVNLIAAIWLIASPYMFNPSQSAAYTTAVVSGIVLGVLALADGLVVGSSSSEMTTTHQHHPL